MPDEAIDFEVNGNVLIAKCAEINYDQEAPFEKALTALVAAMNADLTIDLSGVTYMNSSCIRFVAEAIVRGNQKSFKTKVRARQKIMRLFEMAGINKLGEFELVE
jgi:anti-anti-sigma factor